MATHSRRSRLSDNGAEWGRESCFIPRSVDAPQRLIAMTCNLVTNYSDLLVFDAQHIADGPIGHAKLSASPKAP